MAKTAKHREMDMLHGGLAGRLIFFALPLAFSSILQQLFNSADVAVVGRFAGDAALAAVGSCVALVGIFVNLIVGLSVGPNAVLALLIGQNSRDEINRTLHTVLTFGAALGAALGNVLEPVSRRMRPEIDRAIRAIEESGAVGARMTGSGSAVFGVFMHAGACRRAADRLAAAYPTCRMMRTAAHGVVVEEEA